MAYFICSAPDFSDMLVSASDEPSAVSAFAGAASVEPGSVECHEDNPTPAFIRACQMLGTFLEVSP